MASAVVLAVVLVAVTVAAAVVLVALTVAVLLLATVLELDSAYQVARWLLLELDSA